MKKKMKKKSSVLFYTKIVKIKLFSIKTLNFIMTFTRYRNFYAQNLAYVVWLSNESSLNSKIIIYNLGKNIRMKVLNNIKLYLFN